MRHGDTLAILKPTAMQRRFVILIALTLFFCVPSDGLHAQNATFDFVTSSLGTDATAALEYAGSIWSDYLISDVPIKVRFVFIPVPGGFLGNTTPNGEMNFAGAPIADVWYPSCLANAIAGTELNPGERDMDIVAPSGENWYFGLDGNPGLGQFDFVSLAMHEIGHGLGILSLAKFESDSGSFGHITTADVPFAPSFPFPELGGYPGVWDLFLEELGEESLTGSAYDNPSIELGDEFTSNAIYFDGPEALVQTGGVRPRIYAPPVWAFGSSMTHLDEAVFSGTASALMTPFLASGEVVHEPGPVTLAILRDIGWTIAMPTGIEPYAMEVPELHAWPNPATERFTVSFELPGSSDVRADLVDARGRIVAELFTGTRASGRHAVGTRLPDNLPTGTYIVRLTTERAVRATLLAVGR